MKRITNDDLLLLSHNFQVRFAVFCAYQVKNRWERFPECVEAIRVTELWLEGRVSSKQCLAAAASADYAAGCAAGYATGYAAYAAADSTHVTMNAGYSSAAANAGLAGHYAGYTGEFAVTKIIKEQWDYYNELLHFDDNAEKALLGERYEANTKIGVEI